MLVYALQTDLLFRWRDISTQFLRDKILKLIAKVRFAANFACFLVDLFIEYIFFIYLNFS